MRQNKRGAFIIFSFFLLASGCAPMAGVPSMTLMSRDIKPDPARYELIGDVVEDSECLNWFLIFGMAGSARPNHESVVSRILQKHNADLLLNTEFTTSQLGIPYLFMNMCANVKGQPARIVDGGNS